MESPWHAPCAGSTMGSAVIFTSTTEATKTGKATVQITATFFWSKKWTNHEDGEGLDKLPINHV